mmetsp:Transcript_17640/g.27298  ORF Transcript_17640/g.27298 Transcript_17640/m.27298 type:complete len:130 (+) Transcript_17640:422-811(+)
MADRILAQMSCSQRVCRSQFVTFLIKVFMGSLKQKLLIAFKCFDHADDEVLHREQVDMVLRNLVYAGESGTKRSSTNKVGLLAQRTAEVKESCALVKLVFSEMGGLIFFDEFELLTKKFTSEFFFAIFQ